MSPVDVETIRRAWATFLREGIEATLDVWAEDCVFEDLADMPDARVHVGHAGVVEANRNFTEAWGDLVFQPLDFIDAGEGRVIAVTALRGSGGGSGAPLETTIAWLYEMRDGKIARSRAFASRDLALEAAHN